ncbi:prepilin-type N-terminal cleavage/methylation domain-containing protein [Companilactobacillus futsaii]|uniref:Prepilin-type N-terminal cleavage/methylation domain-containing protein n=2 Tax=Companilactobacillus futsaii TaxID=938155 RepID=A0A5B7T1P4_9LACO|nr:prepilin-type N-terminal cleavage/methylation domain-containing protein [Companilactobacillus futsaii]
MKRIRKGFTLIEMVVVLFIISLLMLIMVPNIVAQKDHANAKSEEAFKTTLTTQAELYLENHPADPTVSIDNLQKENYITGAQAKKAKKIKDLNLNDLVEKDKTDAS